MRKEIQDLVTAAAEERFPLEENQSFNTIADITYERKKYVEACTFFADTLMPKEVIGFAEWKDEHTYQYADKYGISTIEIADRIGEEDETFYTLSELYTIYESEKQREGKETNNQI